MINKGFYVDYAYINLIILIVTIIFISIGVLFIAAKSLMNDFMYLYGRVESLQITKQDDTSEYLTDEEFKELQKEYGIKIDVITKQKITRNTAISLLEILKNVQDRTPKK